MTQGTPASASPDDGVARVLTGTLGRKGVDLSSAVYGSLLVTTLVAVQAQSANSTEFIALSLLIAVGVFWLTEVWSGVVNLRVHGPVTRAGLRRIARTESPMLVAAIIPALVLATAGMGLTEAEWAIDAALLVSLAQLFLWGLAVGLAVKRGWGVALVIAGVDCLFGVVIVVLKVMVLH